MRKSQAINSYDAKCNYASVQTNIDPNGYTTLIPIGYIRFYNLNLKTQFLLLKKNKIVYER